MKHLSRNEDSITEINITPLVDVMLVLLIIFMATAPLISRRHIKVNVPSAAHAESKATETTKVLLNEKRELFINEEKIAPADLSARLAVMVRVDPLLHIALLADKGIPYGEVVEVLDTVRGAGVKKVALEVRSKTIR